MQNPKTNRYTIKTSTFLSRNSKNGLKFATVSCDYCLHIHQDNTGDSEIEMSQLLFKHIRGVLIALFSDFSNVIFNLFQFFNFFQFSHFFSFIIQFFNF